jgi:branched-chain amino acid transport system permease protein
VQVSPRQPPASCFSKETGLSNVWPTHNQRHLHRRGTYALVALAMVIIYKTSEVLNFAQGDMAMLSAFVAFMHPGGRKGWLRNSPFPWPWLFAFALGAFLEFGFLRRAKEPTVLGLIIITLGLQMILYGLASWRWGSDQKNFPFPVATSKYTKSCPEW